MNKLVSPAARAGVIAGVSLILGLLFDLLFFDHVPGISFVLYVSAIIAGLFALASHLHRPVPVTAIWLMLPLGFFAAMVAVRASELLTVLNVFASLLLLLLIARITFHDNLRNFNLSDYARIPLLPFRFLKPLAQTFSDFFASRSAAANHPLAAQITRGVLIAVPVVIVFAVLFASADLVFQKYLTAAFDFKFDEITVARTLLVAFVTLAFTGAYAYIFRSREEVAAGAPALTLPRLGGVESAIVLGSVGVLFFLFILVQLAYLFGGQSNISQLGFTYAEYARKGFFELLAAALIAFGLLWATDKTTSKSDAGHTLAFRVLSGVLNAEVILIMVSAFRRLYLYEQAFGFTTLRLYSHVFVIFLAFVFVLLIIKVLRNQPENRFAFPVFIVAILFLVGMNLLNPDSFIARQNIERFHETGKLDAYYIGNLSADAQAEIESAASLTEGETKQQLIKALSERTVPTDWQSWNLARNNSGG